MHLACLCLTENRGFHSIFYLVSFVPNYARMPRSKSLRIPPGCIPEKYNTLNVPTLSITGVLSLGLL